MSLERVRRKQENLQKDMNRSRTILQYELKLLLSEFKKVDLYQYLDNALQQEEEFVWADFCCGNAVALREANYLFKNDYLKTYGVDILPLESNNTISSTISTQRHKWGAGELYALSIDDAVRTIFQEEYAPTMISADVAKVRLPKKADLITCVWGMPYVDNIAKVIKNTKRNLKPGGLFIFNTDFLTHIKLRVGKNKEEPYIKDMSRKRQVFLYENN